MRHKFNVEGPWAGLNSKDRRLQVQFAKCLITILRHGKFKGKTITVDSTGKVSVGDIAAIMEQSPIDIVNVARADPTRFEVVNLAKSPDDLSTQCWLRALDKHSVTVLQEGAADVMAAPMV